MSVKRSRIARSSSSGDAGVVNQLSSPAADAPELRWHVHATLASSGAAPSAAPAPPHPPAASSSGQRRRLSPRPGILTLSSPAAEDWSQERIGNFLERCFHCEKRIGESDEVFMYGYVARVLDRSHLRAFCTTDCREKQVAMDKLRDERPTESKKVRGGHTAE